MTSPFLANVPPEKKEKAKQLVATIASALHVPEKGIWEVILRYIALSDSELDAAYPKIVGEVAALVASGMLRGSDGHSR